MIPILHRTQRLLPAHHSLPSLLVKTHYSLPDTHGKNAGLNVKFETIQTFDECRLLTLFNCAKRTRNNQIRLLHGWLPHFENNGEKCYEIVFGKYHDQIKS